jgi:predicted phosphodiesterase
MTTTLIIGDSHVEANESLRRFEALGNYIADVQPDNIVQIGDFLSLDSLSAWDLNKRAKMEGRRFSAELKAGKKAVELLMRPIVDLNKSFRANKRKQYKPRLISLLGNHEDRWFRYLDTHPELIDVVDIYAACGFKKFGWEKVDYRKYAHIEGVCFTHVPMNGVNQPISGVRMMQIAAKDHETSVVFGHSHRLAIETNIRHGENSQQIMALNVGCFFEGMPEYADGSLKSKDWWRGVVTLEHYGENKFDVRTYNLERLLEEYL